MHQIPVFSCARSDWQLSANFFRLCPVPPAGSMSTLESSSPFDLLDAAMRDPFLQQAFRQLDQRHLYGVIPRVCRSWHNLSTTSTSSMTVKSSTELGVETEQPDAVISFSEWLQHHIAKITSLDLSLERPSDTSDFADMLHTISSATHLCKLRLDLDYNDDNGDVPESFAGLAALTNLTSLTLKHCNLYLPAFSSISSLTQLRTLDLTGVGFLGCYNEEGAKLLPELISNLGNLTHLTLSGYGYWDSQLVDCVRGLANLVELDIRRGLVSSSSIQLLQGLPITGVWIILRDPGDVIQVASWLERCIPTTLECLMIRFLRDFELQPSQVSCLLAPLRSTGPQLQGLSLVGLLLSQADLSIITGLTQLTELELACKCDDGGRALLQPAFAHLGCVVSKKEGTLWFHAGAAGAVLVQ